jgi:hypothetical protein
MRNATIICCIVLAGCSTPRVRTEHQVAPLVIASCPELAPVPHQTFGDTVSALLALYQQYHACRSAALSN